MKTIAVLYVDPLGVYPKLSGVDCYDERRDARDYRGPHPVVAHPPCGPWGRLRHMYTGSEHACAPAALRAVQAFGGVLEHPRDSLLWYLCGLPRPASHGERPTVDERGGWSLAVDQCDFGHVARKATWLYIVGIRPDEIGPLPPKREPTHWVTGGRGRNHPAKKKTTPVPEGLKICSVRQRQRRRTPLQFAQWLVELARRCRPR